MPSYHHHAASDRTDTGFVLDYITDYPPYTPPHWHQSVELFALLSGSGSLRLGEDGTVTPIRPDALYLLNSREVHEVWCAPGSSFLCIHILPAYMTRYQPNFPLLRFSLTCEEEETHKQEALTRLHRHFFRIADLYRQQSEGYLLHCQSHLYTIAALLVNHFSRSVSPEAQENDTASLARLEPLLEQMNLRHAEELTLDWAASFMALNKEYFCRLFKRCTGITFLQYMSRIRAMSVEEELGTSADSVTVLMERHGVRDIRLFQRSFHELYGCTPTQRRKQLRS